MRCWSCGSELEGLSQPLGGLRDIYTCHNCTGLGYLKEIRDKSIQDSGSGYVGGGKDELWECLPGIIGWILLVTTAVAFVVGTARGGFQMLAITIIYLLFVSKKWALGLLGIALYYLLTVLHIFS